MEIQVAISPELGIELAGFVKQWNETAKSHAVAEASYVEASPKEMAIDPDMLMQGAMFLAGVASSMALDVLKDVLKEQITAFIKGKLEKEPLEEPPEIQVQSIEQPDGSYLLVVMTDEERL